MENNDTTLKSLIDTILNIARTAEQVALRSIGKLRIMLFIGVLAAAWITFYFTQFFSLSLLGASPIFLFLVSPPVILSKFYRVLKKSIGLPQRILSVIERIKGKAAEFVQNPELQAQVTAMLAQRKLSALLADIWRMRQYLSGLKSLGDEYKEISSLLRQDEFYLLINPLFNIFMAIVGAMNLLLVFVAIVTGLLYVV